VVGPPTEGDGGPIAGGISRRLHPGNAVGSTGVDTSATRVANYSRHDRQFAGCYRGGQTTWTR